MTNVHGNQGNDEIILPLYPKAMVLNDFDRSTLSDYEFPWDAPPAPAAPASRKRQPLRQHLRALAPLLLAEYLGTTLALFLGLSGSLQARFSPTGSSETSSWAWGFAFSFAIFLAAPISGAHLNPVISLSQAAFRRFPWPRAAAYIVAQLLAGLTAGALAVAIYADALRKADPGRTDALGGSALYTVPHAGIAPVTAFSASSGEAERDALMLGFLTTVLNMTVG
ncbi:aquaporin-like protein [Trichodelitschia bisporula]|uniref:Aquaporin-like protein n=1 Tax=Trichodelitschia bisporula TaxID=703511 RepID=A0A6G1I3T1_9PEZI|nr:aquaporin-like protein [Trichodelitschia bisporula]